MTSRAFSIGIVVGSISHLAGGLFNSVRRSAQTLSEKGCEVTVYALRDQASEADLQAWHPLGPLLFDTQGPTQLGYAPKLGKALGDHDLLHQHGIWQGFSRDVNAWRVRTGRPVMISSRGMLDPWAIANSGWKKRLAHSLFEGRNLRGAACLHALAASEARSMRQFGLENFVAIIPNGMDMAVGLDDRQKVAKHDGGRRKILFLGRLHPKKGLAELLEAWRLLALQRPDLASNWTLEIAGWDDGGHLEGLRQAAQSMPSGVEVKFPGPMYGSEKHQALSTADAFILPSYSEGLPMSVLEAWAYGLPVMMTDDCNIPEAFPAKAAIRITNHPDELASVLAQSLSRSSLGDYGTAGRSFCRERFTWDAIADCHIETYRWMLGQGGRPSYTLAQGEAASAS